MIFKSIKLNNYRQFRGENEVSFGFKKGKNICVIEATNGMGKTNFLNDINWCLYASEQSINDNHEFGILNQNVFSNLQDGEMAEVFV